MKYIPDLCITNRNCTYISCITTGKDNSQISNATEMNTYVVGMFVSLLGRQVGNIKLQNAEKSWQGYFITSKLQIIYC